MSYLLYQNRHWMRYTFASLGISVGELYLQLFFKCFNKESIIMLTLFNLDPEVFFGITL
jgi:hypothetical protein